MGEYIKQTDIKQYNRLKNMFKAKTSKIKKEIKLGDSIENLMKHDSYKREGGRIKQRSWG